MHAKTERGPSPVIVRNKDAREGAGKVSSRMKHKSLHNLQTNRARCQIIFKRIRTYDHKSGHATEEELLRKSSRSESS